MFANAINGSNALRNETTLLNNLAVALVTSYSNKKIAVIIISKIKANLGVKKFVCSFLR